MLRRLSVENYALIDKLEMELDPHLNIITGETGAGKSILLGALGLLLGAKNDGQAMKDATRNCTVEGTFDLAGSSLEAFFAENDLDYAPETTLTRMITPAGKSRAFVNDVPVQLAQLRELGARLLDIHSQHQNLILSSEEFRTSALDTVAANGELLTQYAAQYARLTELRRRLAALREEAANGRRDEEWLRFQTEELTAANLRPGEQAELEEELAVLENADRIGEVLTSLRNAFDTDETGVLAQLKNSENELNHIRSHYPAAGEYAGRLRSVLEELKDINGSAAAACERLDADPERLAKCSARLDTLIALQQKHRAADEAELIALRDRCAAQLAAIVHSDEEIAQAISVIFLFNIIAALIFPSLGAMLGMSNEGFGLFAGTAVNDTSSVTAAAAAWDGMHPGSNALDHATIVKLTRTLAIIPITLFLAFWQVRQAKRAAEAGEGAGAAAGTFDIKKIFPFFILFFVLASVITTVFALPVAVTAPIKTLSKFFIVMAMAAIGFNTDIVKLVNPGGKPIFMGLCCWIGIACVSLGMQSVLGIW